jgi:RES domain-containing protein
LHEVAALASLPPAWSAIPAGGASVKIGSAWLTSLRSPILLVPSVIVPEEFAALINPLHPKAATITAKVTRLFEYNKLFRA